jgi:hypothetical protein
LEGKQWGILGRKYAIEKVVEYDLDELSIDKVAPRLLQMGARAFKVDGGGFVIRYYAGRVGGGAFGDLIHFAKNIDSLPKRWDNGLSFTGESELSARYTDFLEVIHSVTRRFSHGWSL